MTSADKFLLLYEDLMGNNASQGKFHGVGDTRSDSKPKKITLHDVLDSYDRNQYPTSNPLPSPITTNHLDKLADVYTSVASLAVDFDKAKENPVVHKNTLALKGADEIVDKLKSILTTIKSLSTDLDKLDVSS